MKPTKPNESNYWAINFSRILTGDEVRKIRTWCRRQEHTLTGRIRILIVDLLLNTGMRAAELCNLRLEDTPIGQKEKLLYVWRSKRKKSRLIPISERLADAIDKYYRGDRRATLPAGTGSRQRKKPLFYNQQGRKMTPDGLYQIVRHLGKYAGLKRRIFPHMFRHYYATRLAKKEKDPRAVQVILGHSSLETTQQYLHLVKAQFLEIGKRNDIEV